MKSIIFFGVLLASMNSFAASLEEEVLAQLVANSQDITMVDAGTGEVYEEQLPELLASTLLQNYSNVKELGVLGSTNIECQEEASNYKCLVSIGDGNFEETDSGLVGPDTASSQSFTLDVLKPAQPGGKPKITSKVVKVVRAG
jgi:hypothetical protein